MTRPAMPSLRQSLFALLMAVLGGAAWWRYRGVAVEPPPQPPHERRPDYTVDEFTATTMDATGVPDRRLTALELRHYPDDQGMELERPVLTVFNPAAPPWIIRSETGWVSADGDEVVLRGQVLVDRVAGETTRPLHLQTQELHVQPRQNYAQTDRPVRVTSAEDWVTSDTGAHVWFGDALRVELLGRARSRVAVQQGPLGMPRITPEEVP